MAKIIPFDKNEPSSEEIQEALDYLIGSEYDGFTADLAIARAMWQRHRALVESATWPEPFRSYLIKEYGENHDNGVAWQDWERAISADLPERLLPKAEQLAKLWKRHPPKPRGVLA